MKKTINHSKRIIVTIIIFLTLIFITMSVMSQITKKPFSILGVSYGIVLTPSMEPKIYVGDFVVMNDVAYDNLNIGDVIAFTSVDNRVIIHEIISEHPEGYITQGVNNDESDFDNEGYITEDRYLSKVVWSGGSFIGKYLVNERLLVIGIIILIIAIIFIAQLLMIIYQITERQKYKHKTDLEKYKQELKDKNDKS